MDRRNTGNGWYFTGGIISLAEFAEEHHKAVEADLLKYGYELKDVGHSLSWGALQSFLANIEVDSALGREINPELYNWGTTIKTNSILADIYDVLAMINANLVAVGSHKQATMPKAYPRLKDKKDGSHYGNSAVPIDELRKEFAEKRKKRKQYG